MFHNTAVMQCKEHQRCSQGLSLEPTETAPEDPSVQTLIGYQDSKLLQVMEQIYKGEYVIAPSVFTCVQHDDFMRELQWELSGHMTRAGLWSKRGPADCLPEARGTPEVQLKGIRPVRWIGRTDDPSWEEMDPVQGK